MGEDGLDEICFTWAGALKAIYLSWGHTEDKAGCYQGVEHGGQAETIIGGHDNAMEGWKLWSLTGPLERKCYFLHSLFDFISHSVM